VSARINLDNVVAGSQDKTRYSGAASQRRPRHRGLECHSERRAGPHFVSFRFGQATQRLALLRQVDHASTHWNMTEARGHQADLAALEAPVGEHETLTLEPEEGFAPVRT
jgi:hypothetical protein